MGRGARQQETDSHWTDQHPDSRHWTPHQRALARMMTQEAYEGLYGRGGEMGRGERVFENSQFLLPAKASKISEMVREDWPREKVVLFLEDAQRDAKIDISRLAEDDSFVRALWEIEWQRTIRALEEMGASRGLEMLIAGEEKTRELWARAFVNRAREAFELENIESVQISLYEMVLSGKVAWHLDLEEAEHKEIEEEIIKKKAVWATESPEEFQEFARRVFAPAFFDGLWFAGGSTSGGEQELMQIEKKTIEALCGKEFADKIEEDFHQLRKSGFFSGTTTPDDFYRRVVKSLARNYISERVMHPENPADSPDDGERESLLYGIIISEWQTPSHNSAAFGEFIDSELGQEIVKQLELQDPERELAQISQYLNFDIARQLSSGQIGAVEAWLRARAYSRA